MDDRPDERARRGIGTGWLVAGVVVLALLTAGLVVLAALTNRRDDSESRADRAAAARTPSALAFTASAGGPTQPGGRAYFVP